MKGSLSLDLLFSILTLLIFAPLFISFADLQMENSAEAAVAHHAEIVAMRTGSSFNHFYAIGPSQGATARLSPIDRSMDWFAGVTVNNTDVSDADCEIYFRDGFINATISYYNVALARDRTVTALYPVALAVEAGPFNCTSAITFKNNTSGTIEVTA